MYGTPTPCVFSSNIVVTALTGKVWRAVPDRQHPDKSPVPTAFSIAATAAGSDGVAVLVIAGEADLATSGRFREHVERALDTRVRGLVADVAEVTFMDSTMLRELLRAHRDLGGAGRRFILAAPQPPVRRLLELTGTAGLFTLSATRADAVASA